jgi:outer membrane lipoprotein carrier protein
MSEPIRCTRSLRLAAVLLLLAVALPAAAAAPAEQRLEEFFAQLQALSADFEQVLMDEERRVLQQSGGTMVLQRPGKFRWDYTTPYRQLMIADGRKFWLYDTDLEQVTVRPLDEALAGTPALLLTGEQAPGENFEVVDLGRSDGYDWLLLRPYSRELNIEDIAIALGSDAIEVMEVRDTFGQLTRIRFYNIVLNLEPDPAVFMFVPPVGVDVIGDPR